MTATTLFSALFAQNLIHPSNIRWWPNALTFEVVASAILTQQTKWQNVEKSLENLREQGVLSVSGLAEISEAQLSELIAPSGFKNTKAPRLKRLCANIARDFGDFDEFARRVTSRWLGAQKGVGAETRDAILCYACGRDVMVMDSYGARLLGAFGYEFESYDEAQEWLSDLDFDEISRLCFDGHFGAEFAGTRPFADGEINAIYCYFHGAIDEFVKAHFSRGEFDDVAREFIANIA